MKSLKVLHKLVFSSVFLVFLVVFAIANCYAERSYPDPLGLSRMQKALISPPVKIAAQTPATYTQTPLAKNSATPVPSISPTPVK